MYKEESFQIAHKPQFGCAAGKHEPPWRERRLEENDWSSSPQPPLLLGKNDRSTPPESAPLILQRNGSEWTSTWLPQGCAAWEITNFSGRYHGCHMDALQKWTESLSTLSWLPYGCSAETERVFLYVIMIVTWMLCRNGRSLWTLSCLPHGCSAKTDEVFVDASMVATWMLCRNGRSLCGCLSCLPRAKAQKQEEQKGESPVKMSWKRPFQRNLEFWTRKEQNRNTGKINKRARTHKKKKHVQQPEENARCRASTPLKRD